MDNALKGLLIKEWEMMKGFLIGKYVIAIIILLYFGSNGSMQQGLVLLMAFGFIIVPATVLFSLNTEANQMQSFLHNPQPAHRLLLAKLMYSMLIAVVFMGIDTLSITGIGIVTGTNLNTVELFTWLIYISFTTILVSFYPLAIVLLLWTLHQIWRRYLGGGISIIFVVIVMLVGNQLLTHFRESHLYWEVTQWGSISIPVNLNQLPVLEFGFLASVPIGTYVFHGLIAIALYFISAYLLDRKVEV